MSCSTGSYDTEIANSGRVSEAWEVDIHPKSQTGKTQSLYTGRFKSVLVNFSMVSQNDLSPVHKQSQAK